MFYDKILKELQNHIDKTLVPQFLAHVLPSLDTASFSISMTFQAAEQLAAFLTTADVLFQDFQKENKLYITQTIDGSDAAGQTEAGDVQIIFGFTISRIDQTNTWRWN